MPRGVPKQVHIVFGGKGEDSYIIGAVMADDEYETYHLQKEFEREFIPYYEPYTAPVTDDKEDLRKNFWDFNKREENARQIGKQKMIDAGLEGRNIAEMFYDWLIKVKKYKKYVCEGIWIDD